MDAEQAKPYRQAIRLATIAHVAEPVQHELNNLLTVVYANLEMLKRTASEGAPQRQLDRIQEAARRFDASTRAVLSLLRRPVPGTMAMSLPAAVAAIQPLLAVLLPGRGALTLSLGPSVGEASGARNGGAPDPSVPPQDWLVRLDRAALDEALLALAREAAAALPRGAGLALGVANRPGVDGAPDAVEFHIRRPEALALPALAAFRALVLAAGGDARDEAAGGAATLRLSLPRAIPHSDG